MSEHETFDWGVAAMEALESWNVPETKHLYDWTLKMNGSHANGDEGDTLAAA